jgi:F-type H+-transporting ATPase subunit delta
MTNRTAANRYARALMDVARKEQVDPQQVADQLGEFANLLTAHPTLGKVLLNPAVPAPRKKSTVRELLARVSVAPVLSKLLELLAERDRLVLLPDIVAAYRERLLDLQHVVRAEVTTAAPLAPGRSEAIAESLKRLTGRNVALSTRVDPALVGGIVARVGSVVYDGSVVRQLEKLKERLVQG